MKTEETISFETFRKIGSYEQSNLTSKEPSSFNGWVRIEKYKITVEQIDEPRDVLIERLQKLWDECDNHHQWQPLKNKAEELFYKLEGSAGSKRIK